MSGVAVPVGGTGCFDGVERLTYRAVPESVEVHLEAERVEFGDVLPRLARFDEADAAAVRGAAAAGETRVEHGGGVVLGDAVLHDLHRAGPEPVPAQLLAPRDEFGDLFGTALTVPPQGAGDARGEEPPLQGSPVRGRRVRHVGVRADDGVLPGGDPVGVQHGLGAQHGGQLLLGGGVGHQPAHEVDGALLEHAGRTALGVAFAAAVGGVGGAGVDAGPLQGPGVDPGAVVVAVGQEDGPVGTIASRAAAVGAPPGKASRDQPPPVIHSASGCSSAYARIRRRYSAGSPVSARWHRPSSGPAPLWVDMGVLEAGQQQLPGEVDDLGAGADECVHLVVADGGDPPAVHGHGGGTAAGGIDGVDGPTGEDEVGGAAGRVARLPGLLGDAEGRVPAPEEEHREDHALGEGGAVGDLEEVWSCWRWSAFTGVLVSGSEGGWAVSCISAVGSLCGRELMFLRRMCDLPGWCSFVMAAGFFGGIGRGMAGWVG